MNSLSRRSLTGAALALSLTATAVPTAVATTAATTADAAKPTAVATTFGAAEPVVGCPSVVDDSTFASAERLEALTRKLHSFGELRLPGSPEHEAELAWLESEFAAMPGVEVSAQHYPMTTWLPTGRDAAGNRDLGASARLSLLTGGGEVPLKVPAVQAFSAPTTGAGVAAEVVYLAPGEAPTPERVSGKIVLRDIPKASIPNAGLIALAHTSTPDMLADAAGNYSRGWLTAGGDTDTSDAARAGAVGFIEAFDVPASDIPGYFSSHTGTLQHIPALWVGVDERERLKQAAADGTRVRMGVKARIDEGGQTRNVIATLPGKSSERVVLAANSDGSGWLQENALGPLLEIMRYYAGLPLECRDRTIQVVLGSAHLGFAWDGVDYWVKDQLATGEADDIAFAFPVEHLGARQIDTVDRLFGPGNTWVLSDKTDPYAWFAPTESPALVEALSTAVHRRKNTRSTVLRGIDLPTTQHLPAFCNFGGLGNAFHANLIPTVAGIAGSEALWGPTFGIQALDFQHMRRQTLTVGDTLLALDGQPRELLTGGYGVERATSDAGVPDCSYSLPSKVAPR